MSEIVRLGLKSVDYRGAGAFRRILRHAYGHCDLVCRGKSDSPDVTAKAVRVGLYYCYRIRTILPVYLRRFCYRYAVGLGEYHHFARPALAFPALLYLRKTRRTYAGHLAETC